MRFIRRRPPRLDPKFLVDTSEIVRIDRRVVPFIATNTNGEPWSSAALEGATPTLVLFVKDHCDGCIAFLDAAVDPAGSGLVEHERLIVVVGDTDTHARAVLGASNALEAVLVGPEVGRALRVPGAPFFSLVAADGSAVLSEGVAFGVAQVRGHCRSALAGLDPSVPRLGDGV